MRKDLLKAVENGKKEKTFRKMGFKKPLELIEEQLLNNEEVVLINNATIKKLGKDLPGIFVITTKRVVHAYKIMGDSSFEQIRIKDINNIETLKQGLSKVMSFKIQSISNTMELYINKQLAMKYLKLLNEMRDSIMDAAVAPASAPTVDIADQIKKIAELHEQGILSKEEFDQKKADLLAKM